MSKACAALAAVAASAGSGPGPEHLGVERSVHADGCLALGLGCSRKTVTLVP